MDSNSGALEQDPEPQERARTPTRRQTVSAGNQALGGTPRRTVGRTRHTGQRDAAGGRGQGKHSRLQVLVGQAVPATQAAVVVGGRAEMREISEPGASRVF